jgi:ABC-type multidrug transport system ATPase subunit
MIETENLIKIFRKGEKNEVIAVNNASFTVNDGEVFGLLSPNGAGKTTTLKSPLIQKWTVRLLMLL